jgi:hypothetical protein
MGRKTYTFPHSLQKAVSDKNEHPDVARLVLAGNDKPVFYANTAPT